MLKILLTVVVPVLLPTLLYIAYAAVENRRRAAAEGRSPESWVTRAPWPWLLGGGLVLMILSLALLTGMGADQPVPPGHPAPPPRP